MEPTIDEVGPTRKLKPLAITCTSTDCANGLHCFRATKKMVRANQRGACRECGASLVDWSRIEKRDLNDVDYVFAALQHEMIRHHFWHVDIDQKALNHVRRKGRVQLRDAALQRIRKSVAFPDHPRQGRQTPFEGNILFYAQHAVAACCRVCIEEWYGIPRDHPLDDDQVNFLTTLVLKYVDQRLPDLMDEGIKVPPMRRSR